VCGQQLTEGESHTVSLISSNNSNPYLNGLHLPVVVLPRMSRSRTFDNANGTSAYRRRDDNGTKTSTRLAKKSQESNPMRFVRCKTTSGYEAMILSPAQACAIVRNLREPDTLTLLAAGQVSASRNAWACNGKT